jgi:hypothetical protein
MTDAQAAPATGQGHKTIGVRLPDPIHAQMTLIARLDEMSLTDAILRAVEGYIAVKRGEGDLAARAAQALEEIEREAAARRDALHALFGEHVPTATEASTTRRRGRTE